MNSSQPSRRNSSSMPRSQVPALNQSAIKYSYETIDSQATPVKDNGKLKAQLLKKTLITDQLQLKKQNKRLSKYYRQLGNKKDNFEKSKEVEAGMLKQIFTLKSINSIDQLQERISRTESEKRAIIDNEQRKIKQMKQKLKEKTNRKSIYLPPKPNYKIKIETTGTSQNQDDMVNQISEITSLENSLSSSSSRGTPLKKIVNSAKRATEL